MLVDIFDARLKSLIGYQSEDFTREIVEFMFMHFKDIAYHTSSNFGWLHTQHRHLSQLLSYAPGQSSADAAIAANASQQLLLSLENYIKSTLTILSEKTKENVHDENPDYRKILGLKFNQKVNDHPELFPVGLSSLNILPHLNYTTKYRNSFAHRPEIGNTDNYPHCLILVAYDTLLSYLLYTFYYMAIKPNYQFKNILKQPYGN